MRVFVQVSEDIAARLLKKGHWEDIHSDAGQQGVYCLDAAPMGFQSAAGSGIMTGPLGEVTLCGEIPEDVFERLEMQEGTRPLTKDEAERMRQDGTEPPGYEYQRMGYAIIPAEVLNQHAPPRLYDHEYSCGSRAQLVKAIARGASVAEDEPTRRRVQQLRSAMKFLDQVGWNMLSEHEGEADRSGRSRPVGELFQLEDVEDVEDWNDR